MVGEPVGDAGRAVGDDMGAAVGSAEGLLLGLLDGAREGFADTGEMLGDREGLEACEGRAVVGKEVVVADGLGFIVGLLIGAALRSCASCASWATLGHV
jgi:hypothetical protein